jgi:hypothetical protein
VGAEVKDRHVMLNLIVAADVVIVAAETDDSSGSAGPSLHVEGARQRRSWKTHRVN